MCRNSFETYATDERVSKPRCCLTFPSIERCTQPSTWISAKTVSHSRLCTTTTTTTTDTSQHSRQDSAHDPSDKLARKSTSSAQSSAATGTSTKRPVDGVPQATSEEQPRRSQWSRLVSWFIPGSRGVNSALPRGTPPSNPDAEDRRRTLSVSHNSNANQRQRGSSQTAVAPVACPRSAAHGRKTELHTAAGQRDLDRVYKSTFEDPSEQKEPKFCFHGDKSDRKVLDDDRYVQVAHVFRDVPS